MVCDQELVGMGGPVALNKHAVMELLKFFRGRRVKHVERCFDQVVEMYHYLVEERAMKNGEIPEIK